MTDEEIEINDVKEELAGIRREVDDIVREFKGALSDGKLNAQDGDAVIEVLSSAGNILYRLSVIAAAATYTLHASGIV